MWKRGTHMGIIGPFFVVVLFIFATQSIDAYSSRILQTSTFRRIPLDGFPIFLLGDKVSDVSDMSVKEVLSATRGTNLGGCEGSLLDGVDIVRSPPTVGKFIVANPKGVHRTETCRYTSLCLIDHSYFKLFWKAFFENPNMAKAYGVNVDDILPSSRLEALAPLLPVIYIADVHPEYGTLGFMLNRKSEVTMNDLYPELRSLRKRPVYLGGVQNRGSSFTMVHKRAGFPDNRAWKVPPGSDFKLFYSPNVAMCNEMCLTRDSKPTEFKFFQWSTIWLPKQLDLEYRQKLWLTIEAPVSLLFEDDSAACPLWRRIMASLPEDRIGRSTSQDQKTLSDSYEESDDGDIEVQ